MTKPTPVLPAFAAAALALLLANPARSTPVPTTTRAPVLAAPGGLPSGYGPIRVELPVGFPVGWSAAALGDLKDRLESDLIAIRNAGGTASVFELARVRNYSPFGAGGTSISATAPSILDPSLYSDGAIAMIAAHADSWGSLLATAPSSGGTVCRDAFDYFFDLDGILHWVHSQLVCDQACGDPDRVCDWVVVDAGTIP